MKEDKLHQVVEVKEPPYFRKMKVESGYMYDFYDNDTDEYKNEWTFVPFGGKHVKNLQNHMDRTIGLWATDRPDLVQDPSKVLFLIQ